MHVMEPSWEKALRNELNDDYFLKLLKFLEKEKSEGITIFPEENKVFDAFWKCPFKNTHVVILGQDPYHGEGQAQGLAFSVPSGIKKPPSLRNIFKELKSDLGVLEPKEGCLEGWANQGVLLLNTTLTVRANAPLSHAEKGWERFTDAVLSVLAERNDPLVFILWGKAAQQKCKTVLQNAERKHLILCAAHPSPLSARHGFFGSRPFSQANAFLKAAGKSEIQWNSLHF